MLLGQYLVFFPSFGTGGGVISRYCPNNNIVLLGQYLVFFPSFGTGGGVISRYCPYIVLYDAL